MVDTIDLVDVRRVLDDAAPGGADWLDVAEELAADGRIAAAILAATRAAGRSGDASRLAELVAAHAAVLDEDARKEHTWVTQTLVDKMKRMNADPDRIAARLLRGVLEGAEASYLLRGVAQAVDAIRTGQAGLDIIRGAMALDPSKMYYEDTHAMVLLSLARWTEAGAAIERLAAADPGQAAWLRTYLSVLAEPLTFWPATDAATQVDPADDDPVPVRTTDQMADAIRIAAGRVATVQDALSALAGDADRLPGLGAVPDADRLPGLGAVPDADPGDHDLDLAGQESVPNLTMALREEWTRLVWLCYSAGLDEVGLPTGAPRQRPLPIVDTLLTVRYNILVAVADGDEPEIEDDLDRRMAAGTWGGTPIVDLAPHLANAALDEHGVALAAVRWAYLPDAAEPWT